MKDRTASVITCSSCEDAEHGQNCLDCPHFCGLLRDEVRDTYVVKCGYNKTRN